MTFAGLLFGAAILSAAGETHFILNRETLDAASVALEAEAGVLGSDYVSTNDGTAQFISIQTDTLDRDSPGSSNRVATYKAVFPAAGTYNLYARVRVKVDANDDSFFYGNGFGIKSPTNSDDWNTVNDLYQGGYYEYPSDVVIGSGSAGIGLWKWLNVSQLTNSMTEPAIAFTVTASNLVQTFQIGARENGLDIDRLVFGNSSYKFTVDDLDVGGMPPPAPKPASKIPPKLLQEDFQIMRQALEQGHAGIYWYTSKADLDRTFDRAYRKIDHPMTDLEFWRLAAPVVVHIKCGHTYLWFPAALRTRDRTSVPYLPSVVKVLRGRVYVYQDFVTPGSPPEGAEILSINGVSMKTLLKDMRTFVTGDGNGNTAKDWHLSSTAGFCRRLYAFGVRSPFRVTYRAANGKANTIELEGMAQPDWEKRWMMRNPEPKNIADLKFLDDGKIAVLTIRSWDDHVDPERKLTFEDFLKQSFAQMQKNGTRSLIIDVRDNTGGADPPGKQLFSFLSDHPFYYYKDIVSNAREFDFFKYDSAAKPIPADAVELRSDGKFHHTWHPNLGLQQPRQPHFSGKVFVLMNGGTFSASTEFLSTLHSHKRATFIGEETGGGYYGNTSGMYRANLELPNSKLKLHFGLMTYYQAVSDDNPERGVLPDYPITHTIEDLIAGRDKDMALALLLARSK